MIAARRQVLAVMACLPWFGARAAPVRAASGKVVIVGGGWAGLAAAARLRQAAPGLEVTLIERQPRFFSLPLSNRWLAGTLDPALLWRDYPSAAARHGYRFLRAGVTAIDRERRSVHAGDERLPYDWLVLACGIRHHYGAWCDEHAAAARTMAERFGAAWCRGAEVQSLQQRIETFPGGDWLMILPPGPSRCPPAPYERALAIAHRFRQRGIKARVILLDPGPGALGFRDLFARQHADMITHVAHAEVRSVDPWKQVVATEFDEYRFDDAILMPPQQAGDLVWQAGLIGRTAERLPTGWAAQHPTHLHALDDERVFLVGDLIGPASPLFGHYSKTAHVAVGLGAIAAGEIAARAQGEQAELRLPESLCQVVTAIDPPAALRIETAYRLRGDGVITQQVKQQRDPQPRGEDLAWLHGQLAALF